MEELKYLQDVIENRHEYARTWKREKGSPVLGCFNGCVPEEIIYATGFLPVRIIGAHQHQNITDPHISQDKWCRYCCDCLAEGLKGRYDYLDGIVTTLCCLHLQQSFDSWRRHVPITYKYCLEMPFYVQGNLALECYTRAIKAFAGSLQEWAGVSITEESLRHAIEVYNKNRQLTRKLYDLRKFSPPGITGSQAMEIVLSSILMDKKEHNRILERILEKKDVVSETKHNNLRLMIIGAESDDRETVRLIESLGAYVVVDVHSIGTRYFWNDVPIGDDPMASIAARYLAKIPFPQMDFPEDRAATYAMQFAKDYHIHGTVFLLHTHCDPFQFELPVVKKNLESIDVPLMAIELDPVRTTSRTKTKIEAFLEMLQGI